MNLKKFLLVLLVIGTAALLMACSSEPPAGPIGPAGPAGPQGPAGPPGDDASVRLNYVGSEKCGQCHEEQYAKFVLSGHPYKLTKIDGEAPEFPYDNVTGGVQDPPEGYTWADISYVIGGFGWKARFIDQDGYIITGDADATTQWNFANEEAMLDEGWVPYHAGEQVPYDCGSCHSTGYNPQGHQDDKEGIIGTWAAEGVQCEACHGPGSLHASDPYGHLMVLDRSNQLCGDCHVRGNPAKVDAADGFVKHHEQYEELYNSKHFAIQCIACHDPHASSIYADAEVNPDMGIRQTCDTCHWQQTYNNGERHFAVACTDCHMPPTGVSAQGNLDLHIGDISSHLFSINTDPNAPQFNEDGTLSMPYLTIEYACGSCHNGEYATEKSLEELAVRAKGYHTPPEPVVVEPEPQP